MGTVNLQDVRNEVYKLLGEFSQTTASIDVDITYKVDNQINLLYYELSEKDKVSAIERISQFPVENMLGETFEYDTHTITAINFTQASAYAYYYETDGNHTVDIKEASSSDGTYVTLSTNTNTGVSAFTAYRGFVTATVSSDYIRLSFYGDGVYTIRNVAFYPYTFGNATASIPSFKPYCEYSISADYMDMGRAIMHDKSEYTVFTDYVKEGDKWLIPRSYSAEFLFNYWKQVAAVTTATNTFDIKDKTALIIPYGVAAAILLGNGYNIQAGNTLMSIYEGKKNGINVAHEYGRQKPQNILGW